MTTRTIRNITVRSMMTIVMLLLAVTAYGQMGLDAARALNIKLESESARKTIRNQWKGQTLMTSGYMLITPEIESVTNFQKEFNDYLDRFHDVLQVAAEVYGIYYEVTKTAKNIKTVSGIIADSPTNTLAVAFDRRWGTIYTDIIKNSIDILQDIRKVCFEGSKMTEQERHKIMRGIRPKMRKFNKRLETLALALRYSTLLDLWNQIDERARFLDAKTRRDIIERCRLQWKNNAKSVSIKEG